MHRVDCSTLVEFNDTPELWLDVAWEREGPRRFLGRIDTVLSNEPGALAAVATIIGQQGGNISNIRLTDRKHRLFSFALDLEVKDVEHIRTIIAALQANNFVERVSVPVTSDPDFFNYRNHYVSPSKTEVCCSPSSVCCLARTRLSTTFFISFSACYSTARHTLFDCQWHCLWSVCIFHPFLGLHFIFCGAGIGASWQCFSVSYRYVCWQPVDVCADLAC